METQSPDRPSRFRIDRLEERIAPSALAGLLCGAGGSSGGLLGGSATSSSSSGGLSCLLLGGEKGANVSSVAGNTVNTFAVLNQAGLFIEAHPRSSLANADVCMNFEKCG